MPVISIINTLNRLRTRKPESTNPPNTIVPPEPVGTTAPTPVDIKTFIRSIKIDTFVEIGCHFGTDTEDFRRIHPAARIICFEPDTRNLELLEIRGVDKIAEIYPYALSDKNGKVTFYQSSGQVPDVNHPYKTYDWSYSSSIKKPTGHIEAHNWCKFPSVIEVDCLRLDDFGPLYNNKIDFMWVDVQGAEDMVFAGASETLKRTHYVYTEYSNTELYENQLDINGILKIFGRDWKIIYDYGGDVLLENLAFVES